MSKLPPLTRKDIAMLLDVSTDQVRKNERAWGLSDARVNLNARCVRYRCDIAMRNLRARGLIVDSTTAATATS